MVKGFSKLGIALTAAVCIVVILTVIRPLAEVGLRTYDEYHAKKRAAAR